MTLGLDDAGGHSAQTFEALKADINAKYEGLSRQLQAIARFVLDHPNNVALETTATFARRAQVQPSALVRFAQALGYDRLQRHAAGVPLAARPAVRHHARPARDPGHAAFERRQRRRQWQGVDRRRCHQRRRRRHSSGCAPASTKRALRRASNVLAKARHVYVLGQGKSFPVAFYLHFALLRLERPCTLLSGTGGGIAQQAALIGQERRARGRQLPALYAASDRHRARAPSRSVCR